ncbi:DnaJ domain-containing protein [Fennellomyces sp. T-0311]|nr:DnaJ domain-containing protein [Fennellomyces sp. T-0311]
MSGLPDYYEKLEVSPTATQAEIREAYKKQALLHHPDRLGDNASTEERAEATRKFQVIADAYYILGDPARRQTYDQSRRRHAPMDESAEPHADAHGVFGDVFGELLRPEVEHPSHIWRILGCVSGAALGFIIGNVGGAAVVSTCIVWLPRIS